MNVLAKGLDEGIGHDDDSDDTSSGEDSEDDDEDSEDDYEGFDFRGGDFQPDGVSLLALSKWPGLFSDDVSWRLGDCISCLLAGRCWVFLALVVMLSFSSRPSCCCSWARVSLSWCSTGSSRP